MSINFGSNPTPKHTLTDAHLDELLAVDSNHTNVQNFKFHDSVYERYNNFLNKATSAGDFKGDHFVTSGNHSTQKLEDLANRKKYWEEQIAERKAANPKADISSYEKNIKNVERDMGKHHNLLARDMSRHKSHMNTASEAFIKEHDKAMDALIKRYDAKVTELEALHGGNDTQAFKDAKKILDHNYNGIKSAMQKNYDKTIDAFADNTRKMNEVITDAEKHSGLKFNFAETKYSSEEVKEAQKAGSWMTKAWGENSMGGKFITGAGAILVGKGLYDAINRETNPETGKQEGLMVPMVELGAGALAVATQAMKEPAVQKLVAHL